MAVFNDTRDHCSLLRKRRHWLVTVRSEMKAAHAVAVQYCKRSVLFAIADKNGNERRTNIHQENPFLGDFPFGGLASIVAPNKIRPSDTDAIVDETCDPLRRSFTALQ
jgi:hypothetical protein